MDKLVGAVGGNFNGLEYDVWKRTAQSVISMRHSGVSDVLEGRPCPEPVYIRPRTLFATGRRARAVTRSQIVGESATQIGAGEPPPANHDTEGQPAASSLDQETSVQPASSSITSSFLWSVGDNISNYDEVHAWHRHNKFLYNFLMLSTNGAAASFLALQTEQR